MTDFVLTGEVQTRVFDFVRLRHAIGLERIGLKHSQGSALNAATQKGYVPRALVGRGNIAKRRETAIEYMSYVITLLTSGGVAKQYGEEIVMGALVYSATEECGCPIYLGTDASGFFNAPNVGTMCIHEKVGQE